MSEGCFQQVKFSRLNLECITDILACTQNIMRMILMCTYPTVQTGQVLITKKLNIAFTNIWQKSNFCVALCNIMQQVDQLHTTLYNTITL